MDVLITIAGGLIGAGIGFIGGCWVGFAMDHSDLPMMPAFSGPLGAAGGAIVGSAAATAIFG